jgi:microcompartment protein CcmL/EutN
LGDGLVTVIAAGEVGAVKTAVAGGAAAQKVGELVRSMSSRGPTTPSEGDGRGG